jgi:hypothetical protein
MTASVALMTVTQNPWPKGQDMTQRRMKIYATATIQASTQFYTTGGLALALAGVISPGLTNPIPLLVKVTSGKGNGYVYTWDILDSWPKNTAVVAGQYITDSNGNLQQCTTAGTTNNTAEPTWNQTVAGTTTDGTAVWTLQGVSYGLIKILTGAAAQAQLTELTQSAAIPAAVSGDTLNLEMDFLKG